MKWVYIIICIHMLGSNYYPERSKSYKYLLENSFDAGPIIEYYLVKETDPEKIERLSRIYIKYEEELYKLSFMTYVKDIKKYPFLDMVNYEWRKKLGLDTNFVIRYTKYVEEKYNLPNYIGANKFPDRWPSYRKATESFLKDLSKTKYNKYIPQLITSMKQEEVALYKRTITSWNRKDNLEEIEYTEKFIEKFLTEKGD